MPWAFFAFVRANWKIVLVGIAILIVIGYGIHLRNKYIAEGEARAHQKIERANEISEGKANVGQKNVDQCLASGGEWDRASGVCR